MYSISVGIQICLYSKLYGYLRFVGKKNVLVVKMWVFKNCGYSMYVGIQICVYSKLYGYLEFGVRKNVGTQNWGYLKYLIKKLRVLKCVGMQSSGY